VLSSGQFVDKKTLGTNITELSCLALRSKFSPNLSLSKLVKISNLCQKNT
jgi:hypothetical protein